MKRKIALKKMLAGILAMAMLMTAVVIGAAAEGEEGVDAHELAAEALYSIGLFQGVGGDPANPNFALGRAATRLEALVMLVRLMGAESEALGGGFDSPFDDVPQWGVHYVGYAYEMGWTRGITDVEFRPSETATAAQFLTFILRTLGYEDGEDFEWNEAWELTDELGITDGEFNSGNNALVRGDMAVLSLTTLSAQVKDAGHTLLEALTEDGVFDALAKDDSEIEEIVYGALADIGVGEIPAEEYLVMMEMLEDRFERLLSDLIDMALDSEWELEFLESEEGYEIWLEVYTEAKDRMEVAVNQLTGVARRAPLKYRQAHMGYVMTAQWTYDALTAVNEELEAAIDNSDEGHFNETMNTFANNMLQARESWLIATSGLATIVFREGQE